jgi:predicted AlkP superfamily pyrophosphatase or phosphodiesterase
MIKLSRFLFPLLLLPCFCNSIDAQNATPPPAPPKLVVGIVVDQMRYDLLYRYWNLYTAGGFRRLVNEGYNCKNTRFNSFQTVTAVGHAGIYTGSIPALHGIVENNFYDRGLKKDVYVMYDENVSTVGNASAQPGMSPMRLMSTTITDELKLSNHRSKVIGIALKDRSAIIPAGRYGDAAYFFDSKTGRWISSTWYLNQLPDWVETFNTSGKVNEYMKTDWNLLLPRSAYTMCTSDTNDYERPFAGEKFPVFPHAIPQGNYARLGYTPFALTMTNDLAMQAIVQEKLGKRDVTDFLCISFSSTDIIQHSFGQHSLETADAYIRLDRDLEALLKFLDREIGKENVLVFLTSDHGGAMNPQFGTDRQISGGVMMADSLVDDLNQFLSPTLGNEKWISAMTSQQVYLNHDLVSQKKPDEKKLVEEVVKFLLNHPGILCVYSPRYSVNLCPTVIQENMLNGYYPGRSGDIFYSMKPGWIDWFDGLGTSHGTAFDYDQRVPLLWYGWKIQPGETVSPVLIPDIAPTIATWLNIANPSATTGNPIAIPLR